MTRERVYSQRRAGQKATHRYDTRSATSQIEEGTTVRRSDKAEPVTAAKMILVKLQVVCPQNRGCDSKGVKKEPSIKKIETTLDLFCSLLYLVEVVERALGAKLVRSVLNDVVHRRASSFHVDAVGRSRPSNRRRALTGRKEAINAHRVKQRILEPSAGNTERGKIRVNGK